jgi:hypothetical protein
MCKAISFYVTHISVNVKHTKKTHKLAIALHMK